MLTEAVTNLCDVFNHLMLLLLASLHYPHSHCFCAASFACSTVECMLNASQTVSMDPHILSLVK